MARPRGGNRVLLLLLLIAGWWVVPLWMYGVFNDGIFYASIARNLVYDASASIWDLKVTNALDPTFNGHPPLAFWIQSVWFWLLGDAYWVERVYGLCMGLLTLYLMRCCWQLLHATTSLCVLLFWLCIPLVGWSFANNILENTLVVLTTATVWWMLWTHLRGIHPLVAVLGAGLLLLLATLVKGLVGLFPLVTWGAYVAVLEKKNPARWGHWMVKTLAAVAVVVGGYALLLWWSPRALQFFLRYWEVQLETSLIGQQAVESNRWSVLLVLLTESLIVLALVSGIRGVAVWKGWSLSGQEERGSALFWLLLALSASLPLLISPKQMRFYVLPSTVFYALAAGAWWSPWLEALGEWWRILAWRRRGTTVVLVVGLVICAYWSTQNAGKNARTDGWLADSRAIGALVSPHTEVYIAPELFTNWSLHGYLYRYFYIDISSVFKGQSYALIPKGTVFDNPLYEAVLLDLEHLDIYRRYRGRSDD